MQENIKEKFQIKVEKVVFEGFGIGYLKNGGKIEDTADEFTTVFIINGLPNDIVVAKFLYKKKKSFFCDIENIIQPSPFRDLTRCKNSLKCGACDWVDVSYNKQIALKTKLFNEIYGMKNLKVVKSPKIDYYRNKCFFPVQMKNKEVRIGMYSRNTHEIIPHEHCYLYPQVYKKIIYIIHKWILTAKIEPYNEKTQKGNLRHIGIRSSEDLSSIIVILVTKTKKISFPKVLVQKLRAEVPELCGVVQNFQPENSNVILGRDFKNLWGHQFYTESFANLKLKINHQSFFQINTFVAKIIYQDILANIDYGDVVIDAYSGIGTIGFFVAQKAKQVICIEETESGNIAYAVSQRQSKVSNIIQIHAKTENVIGKVLKENNVDVIILDPPRKGLEKSIIEAISDKMIKKIIYMSCNPMTHKRDLELYKQKGYKLTCLKGYDMFPHTWHIESLAVIQLGVENYEGKERKGNQI